MAGRYASATTREKLARPVAEMEETKANSYVYSQIHKKEEFEKNYAKRKEVLESVTPPDATSHEKDSINKRLGLLSDALVNGNPDYVPPMPEEDQMQRTRAGSVDQHMRWESFWKKHTLAEDGKTIVNVDPHKGGRGAIYEWKDLRRIVYKDVESDMPNAANIEMLRPAGGQTPLHETKLPVSYGFSRQAKKHYDEVFPDHAPTHVEKKMNQLDKLVDKATKGDGPIKKRNLTPEDRERRRNQMRAFWNNKRAAKAVANAVTT